MYTTEREYITNDASVNKVITRERKEVGTAATIDM